MLDCDQAADGLLSVWPELKSVGQVNTGSELRQAAEARWNVPTFAFWRASIEKQAGSQDFVWNTVIMQADSLLQCNFAMLAEGEMPPEVKNLDFYQTNRVEVLNTLVRE